MCEHKGWVVTTLNTTPAIPTLRVACGYYYPACPLWAFPMEPFPWMDVLIIQFCVTLNLTRLIHVSCVDTVAMGQETVGGKYCVYLSQCWWPKTHLRQYDYMNLLECHLMTSSDMLPGWYLPWSFRRSNWVAYRWVVAEFWVCVFTPKVCDGNNNLKDTSLDIS